MMALSQAIYFTIPLMEQYLFPQMTVPNPNSSNKKSHSAWSSESTSSSWTSAIAEFGNSSNMSQTYGSHKTSLNSWPSIDTTIQHQNNWQEKVLMMSPHFYTPLHQENPPCIPHPTIMPPPPPMMMHPQQPKQQLKLLLLTQTTQSTQWPNEYLTPGHMQPTLTRPIAGITPTLLPYLTNHIATRNGEKLQI